MVSMNGGKKYQILIHEDMMACTNGGEGGNFSKVKRLIAKWVGTRKRLFSGFFCGTGGILEKQELFPKACFTHNPIYAYLPLVMGS